ncbi:MAG: Ger(x)C family spore germination protein [Christensenellales bacterium]|jgi:spore germination protein KC
MKKKCFKWASILLSCLFLSGCWDYRGLDTLDIATGMAVDKDPNSGNYLTTMEIVDTRAGGEEIRAIYVESQGETLFDAIRNSKRKLIDKIYGGNLQTIIISKQIAETEGVDAILEQLLRDGEPRETLTVAISQEDTAGEILLAEGLDSEIIAYEIHEMVIEDSTITASTKNTALYETYEALYGVGNALVLPVVRCVKNTDQIVTESYGIALFKGDRLIGFDHAQNSMLYLFMVDELEGGVISFSMDSEDDLVSTEIKRSQTSVDVSIVEGVVHVSVQVKTKLHVTELKSQVDISSFSERGKLEARAGEVLQERIAGYFKYAQAQFKTDIFGLGNQVYQKDPDLWRSIENEWDSMFQNAVLEVQAQADILTAGVLKNY